MTAGDLGKHLATHGYSTASEQWNLVPAGGVTGLALALLLAGVRTGTFLLIGGGVWLALTIVRIASLRARFGGAVIERHEQGLVVSLRTGPRRVIPFDEIDAFIESRSRWELLARILMPSASGLGVFTADRSPKDIWEHRIHIGDFAIELDRHWSDVRELVAHVRQSRRAALLHKCKRKLDAGEPVAFGAVELSTAGVRVGPRTLSWDEVADVAVLQGDVVIRRKPSGRFAGIDTCHVPDTDVLIELSRTLRAKHPSYR